MKNSRQKPVFRIAFCSVIAALETVFMMVAGLFRFGTYALPCFAGILTVAIVIEYGCKWAFGVYAVAAALSFFLSGDKEAVVMFIALFGYYPILKNILERAVANGILRWVIKYAVFNAAAVGSSYTIPRPLTQMRRLDVPRSIPVFLSTLKDNVISFRRFNLVLKFF